MNKSTKYMMIGAALILVLTFFFPIWQIDLSAPQYPEGLGLRIWVNQITGMKEGDLNLINNLNHYIGMKTIHPESIPELSVMPYILIFFIATGLIVGFVNKKWLKIVWVFLFLLILTYGFYDFYSWEYDYGHNLNSNAPIKVPGMSYQPPLIGSKQLLNMNASSYPGLGTIIIIISIILVMISIYGHKNEKME